MAKKKGLFKSWWDGLSKKEKVEASAEMKSGSIKAGDISGYLTPKKKQTAALDAAGDISTKKSVPRKSLRGAKFE